MPEKLTLIVLFVAGASFAVAQTSTPLSISGSADTYYKYDFAKTPNIQTSFATDHNSVSIGMLDLALKKSTGKTSFVGEFSFGPRGQYQSVPNGDGTDLNSFNVQNLYATYTFSPKFSMTAGYMSTFIGYEVISPLGNFNYSTSYLFTSGPFQNSGIKANITFSDKVGLMLGLFNDQWNAYKSNPSRGVSNFGAQLTLTPVKDWNAYLNVISGSSAGTELDLTTSYRIADLKLGLNLADHTCVTTGGFTGEAVYAQYKVLGLRLENFKAKAGSSYTFISSDQSVLALTVSGNIKSGNLTLIPEIRFDNGSATMFKRSNGSATRSASQFALAAVYAF